MTRARVALIVGAGLALTLLLTAYYLRVSPLKHLDSVFLYESSLSVLESGQPTSATLPSYMREAITAFTLPAEELCQADLSTQDPRAYNILESHAYLAIFPIALLTSLAGPEAAFAILNALAHVSLVVIPMFVIWRSSGALAAVLMGLWVVVYPVWSYSATGDYYLDRLSMPFVLLSLFLMDAMTRQADRLRDPRWLIAWTAATVAAASFTERAALMMIGLIGFFLVFFPVVRRT
ncbi:MAG TPA: hypothetical protein VJZ50_02960, partial [Candidatus Limnocylindrales bacterium]|nr:hypothetical protein [Candidatus Limnocylindrales bacterium]